MRRGKRPVHRRMHPSGQRSFIPRPQRLLRRAHHMMENGEHAGAAKIFESLAQSAHDRGILKYAPNLYLQAARAQLLSGDIEQGQYHIFESLKILANQKRWSTLARASQRILRELNQLGHPELAEKVSNWLSNTLPEPIESYSLLNEEPINLPLKCPNCGGTLIPNEIEMLDKTTGECPYCGSPIRGN